MTEAKLVQVSGVEVVKEGAQILRHIDLSLPKGAIIGLLGPSGCGKTTLMRTLLGLQKIAGGKITILNHPAGSPQLREHLGYSSQSGSIYLDLTVAQNLQYFASLYRNHDQSIESLLAHVELSDQKNQLAASLSGGEKSRLSLACALAGRADLLILDEPTVGLDPILRRDLWQLFHSLKDMGKTLLISSHVMDEAEHCDQVILMRQGEIVAFGSQADLTEKSGLPADARMEEVFIKILEGISK